MNTPSIIIIVTVSILLIAAWLDYRTSNAKMLEQRENCEIRDNWVDAIHKRIQMHPTRNNPDYLRFMFNQFYEADKLCGKGLITSNANDLPTPEFLSKMEDLPYYEE